MKDTRKIVLNRQESKRFKKALKSKYVELKVDNPKIELKGKSHNG